MDRLVKRARLISRNLNMSFGDDEKVIPARFSRIVETLLQVCADTIESLEKKLSALQEQHNASVETWETRLGFYKREVQRLEWKIKKQDETIAGWVKENSTGGWIDNLRKQVDMLKGIVDTYQQEDKDIAFDAWVVNEGLTWDEHRVAKAAWKMGQKAMKQQLKPYANDGETLRLAVKLRLSIHLSKRISASWVCNENGDILSEVPHDDAVNYDPCAATRLAVFQAAVKIRRNL